MRLAFILILFLFVNLTSAQKQITHQQQIWYRYNLKISIGELWQIRQEFEDRNFINPSRQFQFLSRTAVQRNLGKGWNTAIGLAYFEQANPTDPTVKDFTIQRELRPFIEFAYVTKPGEKWILRQRLWTEFRFFQQDDHSYKYNNIRVRYRFEGQYILSSLLSLFAYDEIFINLGSNIVNNTFDQNRYALGIQITPVKNITFEVSYINWFQQRPSGFEYYQRNIIRLALNHTIPIQKKTTEPKS